MCSLPSLSSFPSLLAHIKGDKADVRAMATPGEGPPSSEGPTGGDAEQKGLEAPSPYTRNDGKH